jgi:hypothetical protein
MYLSIFRPGEERATVLSNSNVPRHSRQPSELGTCLSVFFATHLAGLTHE